MRSWTVQGFAPLGALLAAVSLSACGGGGGAAGPTTAAASAAAGPVLPPDEAAAAAADHVDILFEEGSDRLSPVANQQLDVAARLYRDVQPVKMFAIGHSDPKGNEFSNLVLSARRARAVREAMVARGIPGERVLLQAMGDSALATPGSPDSPDNRRVVVRWQKS